MRFWPRRKPTRAIASAAAAIVMIGGGVFIGTTIATAAPSTREAGQLQKVYFISDNAVSEFTTETWGDLLDQTVQGGDWVRLVRVRLNGTSACFGPDENGHCAVQISIGGTWAPPSSGIHYKFDEGTPESRRETESMEVAMTYPNGIASIRVRVQAQPRNGVTKFSLDDWSVSIELFS